MVRELGVSYYGFHYPDRAEEDFLEIIDHNCNAVLLAVGEYDYQIWYPNVVRTAEIAKALGLSVYVNLWAFGRVFGGEPPSVFLQDNVSNRQVLTKELPFLMVGACFNTEAFRKYFFDTVSKFAKEEVFDGFFWDEPHYIITGSREIYSCVCPRCRELFKEQYGYDMPGKANEDVFEFKEKTILNFLEQSSKLVKEIDSKKSVTVCLMPFFTAEEQGASWDKVCSIKELDVFGTDPYWSVVQKDMSFVSKVSKDTVKIARKYGKKSQLWIQGFSIPAGKEEEVREAGRIIGKSGVDSIFTWAYRACEGSVIQSGNPKKVWSIIKEVYEELKE
nr:hypothetical protein [Candidatus Freyarchaeota archaeon]